jgi:hypothetical protein
MTPKEIFVTYDIFKEAMAGTNIAEELKLQVAKEFLHNLPPAAFSAGCPVTRKWLADTVQTKINQLQEDYDRRQRSNPPAPDKEAKKATPKEAPKARVVG